MSRFKSGIILKTRTVIAQGANDSHRELLKELNIANASTEFVRVELIPINDEWWTNPSSWELNIEQDTVPEWFSSNKEKYIKDFKDAVMEWWKEHVLINLKIEELRAGYYRLFGCEVERLTNDVQVVLSSTTVDEMRGNSVVQEMVLSTIRVMLDNSKVQVMSSGSIVQELLNKSMVQEMCFDATVQIMSGNAIVQEMHEESVVQQMSGNAVVHAMFDSSTVQKMYDNAIAKDYSKGIVHISEGIRLKLISHKNEVGKEYVLL